MPPGRVPRDPVAFIRVLRVYMNWKDSSVLIDAYKLEAFQRTRGKNVLEGSTNDLKDPLNWKSHSIKRDPKGS